MICALQSVVFDAEGVIGVDGSPEMISTANFLSNPKCCSKQNFVEYLGFYFSGLSEIFARQGVTAKRCTNVQLFGMPVSMLKPLCSLAKPSTL